MPKDREVTNRTNPVKPVNIKDLDINRINNKQRDLLFRQLNDVPVNPATHQSIFPNSSKKKE
jgi:hypothetical protein